MENAVILERSYDLSAYPDSLLYEVGDDFACAICNERSKYYTSLLKHIRNAHHVDEIECVLCKRKTKVRNFDICVSCKNSLIARNENFEKYRLFGNATNDNVAQERVTSVKIAAPVTQVDVSIEEQQEPETKSVSKIRKDKAIIKTKSLTSKTKKTGTKKTYKKHKVDAILRFIEKENVKGNIGMHAKLMQENEKAFSEGKQVLDLFDTTEVIKPERGESFLDVGDKKDKKLTTRIKTMKDKCEEKLDGIVGEIKEICDVKGLKNKHKYWLIRKLLGQDEESK
jgi:hypothetical protein